MANKMNWQRVKDQRTYCKVCDDPVQEGLSQCADCARNDIEESKRDGSDGLLLELLLFNQGV